MRKRPKKVVVYEKYGHFFMVYEIFSVVIIILTTSASLRAVDPLFGCLTVKLIIGGHLPIPTSARSNDTGDAEHGPGC
jgi:hypothetical protein